jgi:hypothetical protein
MLKPIFKNFAKDMIYLWSFFQDSLHWVGTIQQTAKLLKCLLNCLLIVEATQHSTIWTTSGLEVTTQHPHALSFLLHRKSH